MKHDQRLRYSLAFFLMVCPGILLGQVNTFGTKSTTYYRITEAEFFPILASAGYVDGGVEAVYRRSSSFELIASPHLPSGALLTYVRLDYCDTSVAANANLILRGCDPYGNCDAEPLANITSSGSAGCGFVEADLTGKNFTVDNFTNELLAIVNTSADFSVSVGGVVLGYKLQISEAPANATFGDVPTSHTYFRAIEALAASGISGGCGSGNFCPEGNVTRGEMAAFLARALGLHFQ